MKLRQLVLVFASMTILALLGGCEDEGLDGLTPERNDYNFETSCKTGNSDIEDCSSCCEGISGNVALVARGSCGCAVSSSDDATCSEATSFDTCAVCCEDNDFEPTVSYSCINGECTCTCFDVSPVVE